MDELIAHLDLEADPAETGLPAAERHATEYGAAIARLGASLCDSVEELVRLRGPVAEKTAEIVRRRRLDEDAAASLVVDAEKAFDRLLIALMTGYSAARTLGTAGRHSSEPKSAGLVKN